MAYLALKTMRDAALVMINLPLAWMGGVIGLWASGGVMSVATLISFITLFGIAMVRRNFNVSYANQETLSHD